VYPAHSLCYKGEALASWGTDDSVVLSALAAKLGTSVVSTLVVNDQFGF